MRKRIDEVIYKPFSNILLMINVVTNYMNHSKKLSKILSSKLSLSKKRKYPIHHVFINAIIYIEKKSVSSLFSFLGHCHCTAPVPLLGVNFFIIFLSFVTIPIS